MGGYLANAVVTASSETAGKAAVKQLMKDNKVKLKDDELDEAAEKIFIAVGKFIANTNFTFTFLGPGDDNY